MVKYRFENGSFIIEDYQKAKTFSSFLPAVAGVDGKPLWAFYANVGQAMGGFGVTSKDTPITPFDSASLAYQNIPVHSFRTFLKVGGEFYAPFFPGNGEKDDMTIRRSDLSISEKGPGYAIEITYFTIPRQNYAALVRKVTYKNLGKKAAKFVALDGLPVFFPYGLSNISYKESVSLMAAYCQVYGLEDKRPFVKFKTSTKDNSVVKEAVSGNGFFAKDENGRLLPSIVDPAIVFGNDLSLLSAHPFAKKGTKAFLAGGQQTDNRLPCAFSLFERKLLPGEETSVYEVYGMFDDVEVFHSAEKDLTVARIETLRKENAELIEKLLAPANCHTASPLFDDYLKQSYLDNDLRGGFPVLLDDKKNGQVYYVYGRKHGDMERDYNDFSIPSRYYSSGPGNFRDVNQNRRNDLFFHPFVGDYNIRLFFNLIQADGQNPLNVKPEVFCLNKEADLSFLGKESKDGRLLGIAAKYEPSDLYAYLKDTMGLAKEKASEILADFLSVSHQEIEANFAEGYWIDHWTYNVDLLENYSAIFPDKEESLLFASGYRYFYSPVYVEPRSEKTCLLSDGKIRQYGAIDLNKLKDVCEKKHFDIKKTAWLTAKNGQEINVDLASKIINLVLVKFSALDTQQMGIEMECEKPGWNDAMNGLPGLFSSGLSESVELLRLVRYARKHLAPFEKRDLTFLDEQYALYGTIKEKLPSLMKGELTPFLYWDAVTSAREKMRFALKDRAEGSVTKVSISEILPLLKSMDETLEKGIQKAKTIGNGILPSYLIYDVASYEKTDHVNHLGFPTVKVTSFSLRTIPPFLEASARALKLGPKAITHEDCLRIKRSGLYDKTFRFYKTCASLDKAPFEIGRVHAFTKGWLERECNFLHMSYKYMLGLLTAGYYEDFYKEIKTNFVVFMDPKVYGRSPIEASSFVVPDCNPDASKRGEGFFARLTGANAEFLNMYMLMFAGPTIFEMDRGKLVFSLSPKLSKEFFDKKDEASFLLFGKTKVTYHNPRRIDCYKGVKLKYAIEGKTYEKVEGPLAESIREGEVGNIYVEIDR
ncbi:MAG: cellobiose phosphorylase [Bacilli bacterium]|jgi:hypothetical protein|nr:cellobiose phosphorylase [Bacilli bacterium]